MRYFIQILLLVITTHSVFAQTQGKSTFEITIEQGGRSHSVDYSDALLTLKPEPFIIHFTLNNIDGVYVNTSLSDEYHSLAINEKIPNWANIPFTVMAEENFNEDKDINVDGESMSYWNYSKNRDWHRMDKETLKVEGNKVFGTYTVNQLFLVEIKKHITISDFDGVLYLFFFTASDGEGYMLDEELDRRKIKLKFAN